MDTTAVSAIGDSFSNLTTRLRYLESHDLPSVLQNLAPNGGFDSWPLGAGPFTADGSRLTPAWTLVLVNSSVSVAPDSASKDFGSVYDAAVAYTHVGGGYARLQQTLAQSSLYVGRSLALSVRVRAPASMTVRAYISTDGGTTLVYSDAAQVGSSTYQTLTLVVVVPATAGTIVFGVEVTGVSGTAYVDNLFLTNSDGAFEYRPAPEKVDAVAEGYAHLVEVPTPTTPLANEGFLYAKDVSGVSTPFWIGDNGTEFNLLVPTTFGPGSGVALTKTDDTNVTLTLTGDPTHALVHAANVAVGWTGQLAVTRGGTGLASVALGDLLYGSGVNTLSTLAKDTNATRYLSNTGASNLPAWAQVNLTAGVTGTLPVANGGTGVTSSTGTISVVLSNSPTFTGTVTAAAISATSLSASTNITVGGESGTESSFRRDTSTVGIGTGNAVIVLANEDTTDGNTIHLRYLSVDAGATLRNVGLAGVVISDHTIGALVSKFQWFTNAGSTAPTLRAELGSTVADSSSYFTLNNIDTTVSANQVIGQIKFQTNDTQTTTNLIAAMIEAQAVNTIATDINPGRLVFYTTPATVAAALVERMRILSTGGITIATPDSGFGMTISGGGYTVTGDSTVTGALTVTTTLTVTSTINGQTISSAANFTGSLTTSTDITTSTGRFVSLAQSGENVLVRVSSTAGFATTNAITSYRNTDTTDGNAVFNRYMSNDTGGTARNIGYLGFIVTSHQASANTSIFQVYTVLTSATPTLRMELGATSGGGSYLLLDRPSTAVTANDIIGQIQFQTHDSSTTTNLIAAMIEAQASQTITTDINPGRLIFYTTPATVAAALVERMRIASTGQITMATADSGVTLTISGGGFTVTGNSTLTGTLTALTGLTSSGTITFSGLTASRLVATDASSNLVSTITVANFVSSVSDLTGSTGTGNLVLSVSPTFTGTVTTAGINATALTASVNISVGGASGTESVFRRDVSAAGLASANAIVAFSNQDTTNGNAVHYRFLSLDAGATLRNVGMAGVVITDHAAAAVVSKFQWFTNAASIGPTLRAELGVTVADTSSYFILNNIDTSVSANQVIGQLKFQTNDTQTTTNLFAAMIEAQATNTIATDINPGRLIFYTTGTGVAGALTERMRISEAGNVGINVTGWGTSAAGVLGIGNGTEPSSSPIDMVQLYSVDLSAGNATLGLRTETAVVTETVTSDRTLSVRINGTTYKICLKS